MIETLSIARADTLARTDERPAPAAPAAPDPPSLRDRLARIMRRLARAADPREMCCY